MNNSAKKHNTFDYNIYLHQLGNSKDSTLEPENLEQEIENL